jgi:hypothetical protein
MEKVVERNHLIIYWKGEVIARYYTDADTLSALTEEKLIKFKQAYKI